MTQPLTFGVELEFALAYLKDESISPTDPDYAEKILRFTTTEADWADKYEFESREDFFPHAIRSAAKRSVRNTIKDPGFLVTSHEKEATAEAEVSMWAFYFTNGGRRAAGSRRRFSIGLHVHLHQEHRQNGQWAGSMRESSPYAREYFKKHSRRPHPLTGVLQFLNYGSTMELIEQANFSEPGEHKYKFAAYNLQGMADQAMGIPGRKATIEFRQHGGTLNSEAIINTAVGIVDYLRKVDNGTLLNLLRIVENEKWQKLGDGEDAEREATLGPILAESKFTIIDLLSELGLHGPAAYYRNRWTKLPKRPRDPTPTESENYSEEELDPELEELSDEVSKEVSETGTDTSQPQADDIDADDDLEKTLSGLDAENEELDKEIA
ncbi:hypothetical protein N431DRAFT_555151 [Stipitochalara longipes BDJ]|nr:hypothetical protein N431DRAFT_555151 [Stipitochalara longipes BDJ]